MHKQFYFEALSVIVLCCVGIVIYSNTFQSTFHFDDTLSIVKNPNIRDLSNLKAIWNFWPMRFVTYLSVAFNYHFSKLDVFGYHLFNLVVHLGAACLVWWLTLLTISPHANLIAFFVGLVFVTHPIQTQAVTYIIQRSTLLASFFYIASLSLYVKARLQQREKPVSNTWKIYYGSSLLAAVIGMFAKEMAITLPLTVCLYEFCFLRSKKDYKRKYIVPFLIIILIIPLTMLITKSVDIQGMRRVGEDSPGISSGHYFLTQLRVMVTYLRLVFIPLNQNLDYDYPIARSLFHTPVFLSLLLLFIILFFGIRVFHKYRIISFSIFWFFITLLPESSVIPIKDVIFEHRLYLPMAGFCFFIVSWIYYLFQEKRVKFLIIILSLLVASYSIKTYYRNKVWENDFTLWNDTVRKSPQKERPHTNRGTAYQDMGNLDQAILDYDKAIEIAPYEAEAYNNRGFAYQKKANFQQAILDYNKAIELGPNKFAEAYYNRGRAYQIMGNLQQAISDYNKTIEIKPDYYLAYNNRGVAYQNMGNFDQALSDYNKAIEIDPNQGLAYSNRAITYFLRQEYNKSWEDVYKAEALGRKVEPGFLEDLKRASGRER